MKYIGYPKRSSLNSKKELEAKDSNQEIVIVEEDRSMIGLPWQERRYEAYEEVQENERSCEDQRFERKENVVEQREREILRVKSLEMPIPPALASNWKNKWECEPNSKDI
ncbi:hypothetical protein HZH68_006219 [Vespula germanica]|uniref:Uncharacterized protein n=1 Tax=Vespula germanica TaxID=30212 RepID=A0A834NB30_VESGE|nr:hypothetical protein HZH68_006219 [Vespula germanica]